MGSEQFPSGPSPRSTEATGRTVEEAVANGLRTLGLPRDAAKVEVIDEGSRGVLGIGGREARVRVSDISEATSTAQIVTTELLALMGAGGDVSAEQTPGSIKVNISGTEVGPLIGKHGQTLRAMELILGLLTSRRSGAPIRIELDAEGYRQRREASLQELAMKMAERAVRQRREIVLGPMGPRDRRIVHLTLQDHPSVGTVSRGENESRRVVIVPKGSPGERGSRTADASPERQDPTTPPVSRERGSGKPAGDRSTGRPPRAPSQKAGSPRRAGRLPEDRPGQGGASKRSSRHSYAPKDDRKPGAPRPEGLPVDEELEAEIEAYLARTQNQKAPGGEGGSVNPGEESDEGNADEK